MHVVRFPLLLFLLSGLIAGGIAPAQKPEKQPASEKTSADKACQRPAAELHSAPEKSKELPSKEEKEAALNRARQVTITPEREAAVISFVERNHPELAGLLAHLKTNQPKEYDRALRDLFRVTERLALILERDERQYELEIQVWKAQSRAQLLVARLKMTDPDSADRNELKKQLREVLAEQLQARLGVLRLERERVAGRLEKLDEEIRRMESDSEKVIDMHVKNLTNQVNPTRSKPRTPENKPAKKP
jgi:hypothetical protein